MKAITIRIGLLGALVLFCNWGFFAHKQINRLAVFTLPPEMIGFYKANLQYIATTAVNPDRRRYAVAEEAPRHYIDLDHYGDSALYTMPRYWKDAVLTYTEDTLTAHGIVPWHINRMYYILKEAFLRRDAKMILKYSAELGHYVADAHVPLHTTQNYNGQLTGQEGIHGLWESRLPELFSNEFDYFVGRATYIVNPQLSAWDAVRSAHVAVDSVLGEELKLSQKMQQKKFTFETIGKQTVKVYSQRYAQAYAASLHGMVERQMRASIKLIGSLWYSAWIDAGQPDLNKLIDANQTEAELAELQNELQQWRERKIKSREHEVDD